MILFGGINLLIVDFSGEHFKEMSALTFRKLLSLFTGTPFRHKVLPPTHPAQPLPQTCMTRIELKWQFMTNDQDWCFSPSASLIPRGYENTQMEAYFICFEKYWGTGKQRCNSERNLWVECELKINWDQRGGRGLVWVGIWQGIESRKEAAWQRKPECLQYTQEWARRQENTNGKSQPCLFSRIVSTGGLLKSCNLCECKETLGKIPPKRHCRARSPGKLTWVCVV